MKLTYVPSRKTPHGGYLNNAGRRRAASATKARERLGVVARNVGAVKANVIRRAEVSDNVRRISLGLSAKCNAIDAAYRIARFVAKTKIAAVPLVSMRDLYNIQTADDVVVKRTVPSVITRTGPQFGCQTFAATLAAMLRAAGPAKGNISNVRFVRTVSGYSQLPNGRLAGSPHSLVRFKIGRETYYADPFEKGKFLNYRLIISERELATPITDQDAELADRFQRLRRQGSWKEADEIEDLGTVTFSDYIREKKNANS